MIKGIIFDFGHTLFQLTADSEALSLAGATEMATWYLKKKHVKLDADALVAAFEAERKAGYARAVETQTEVLAEECLRAALKQIDAPASAGAFTEAAIKIYFGPAEAAWQPYPDAVATLQQLHAAGYRLGLYSNVSDDKVVQRLINKAGLRPWLSPTFSSAGTGWRKPRPDGLQLIARRWGLEPAHIVMVGDSPEADIVAAHNAGMRGILVGVVAAAAEAPFKGGQSPIQPDATAARLSDLPGLLTQL
ncbi:MAG: HAD-IA family hydrolase [Anaerolineae bacterium]